MLAPTSESSDQAPCRHSSLLKCGHAAIFTSCHLQQRFPKQEVGHEEKLEQHKGGLYLEQQVGVQGGHSAAPSGQLLYRD